MTDKQKPDFRVFIDHNRVKFAVGNQKFSIRYNGETGEELAFLAKMLESALRRLTRSPAPAVLHQLLHILGTTPPTCCGCTAEWQAAIDLIKRELE